MLCFNTVSNVVYTDCFVFKWLLPLFSFMCILFLSMFICFLSCFIRFFLTVLYGVCRCFHCLYIVSVVVYTFSVVCSTFVFAAFIFLLPLSLFMCILFCHCVCMFSDVFNKVVAMFMFCVCRVCLYLDMVSVVVHMVFVVCCADFLFFMLFSSLCKFFDLFLKIFVKNSRCFVYTVFVVCWYGFCRLYMLIVVIFIVFVCVLHVLFNMVLDFCIWSLSFLCGLLICLILFCVVFLKIFACLNCFWCESKALSFLKDV